jgi:hypothetical protein
MGVKSDWSVNLIDEISDLYKGEYQEIKDELKDIFIQIGKDLGWTLKESYNEKILFKTPFSFKSIGETVTVNYYDNKITIESVSNQKSIMTTWGKNDENCKKYLNNIVPEVKKYLQKKESSRQAENLEVIEKVQKEFTSIEVNEEFTKLIKENQPKIDKEFIPQFLKIISYYELQVKTYSVIYENTNRIDFHQNRSSDIESSVKSLVVYSKSIKLLELSINELLKSYLEEDLINFYSLHNKFEEMGLMMSQGEKIIVNSLVDINSNLTGIIDSIDNLTSKMGDLGNKLNEINNSLEVQNLISILNTYQTYKINKNTKSLRG